MDTSKVDELMEVMEKNINAEMAGGGFDCLRPEAPKPKVDRKLERALHAELTIPEIVEFDRRRRARARACWEVGDQERKWLWGGW
jgi:hypothetical protein